MHASTLSPIDRAERMQNLLTARGFEGHPPRDPKTPRHSLPEARADLADFAAWQAATAASLAAARAARPKLLGMFGVPAATEAAIADLVEADAVGVREWLRGLVSGLSPADVEAFDPAKLDLRSFERAQLETKLANDRHRAEVARTSLDELETETEILEAAVARLAERKPVFVKAAAVAETDAVARRYYEAAHEMAAAFRVLLAAVGGTASAREITVPVFDTPFFRETIAAGGGSREGFKFGFGPVELRKAGAPWRALADALDADPLVKAEPILSAPIEPAPFAASNGARVTVYDHGARLKPVSVVNVCPARDVLDRGEMDPLPEWYDEFGEPANFGVRFVFGEAEVDAALGDYLVTRGFASDEPPAAMAA